MKKVNLTVISILIYLFLIIVNHLGYVLISEQAINTMMINNQNDTKLDIEFDDYYFHYNGYIDQVSMFGSKYDNQDYDGDGLFDRIYRRVFENYINGNYKGMLMNYRVDFGNGETLEIGDFNDIYTSINLVGEDITGDNVNEMIFYGEHIVSTFPPSNSEIAVYKKINSSYTMMELPRQDDWDKIDKFDVGYSLYKDNLTNNRLTVINKKTNFEDVLIIDDERALDYVSKAQSLASPAWKIDVINYNGLPTIVLYNHIGTRYLEQDLLTYLTWKNDSFTPIKMEIR